MSAQAEQRWARTHARGIGPIGSATRFLGGAGLLYLALLKGTSWRLTWYEALLGLFVLPAVMLIVGLLARRRSDQPVRFTGPSGIALNCAVIVGLLATHYTAGAAELFYGATLLVAAARGQAGCESTVLSNWILNRNDQIGCPVFSPIDQLEARARTRDSGR